MTALWTHSQAEQATGGKSTAAWTASGVSIDSRSLAAGDLFIALSGPNNDAHDYLPQVAGKNAAAAVVNADRVEEFAHLNLPLLGVEDPMQALRDLAIAARARCGGRVIGVTGSVGKTGTKEALALAFGALGRTHATQGNLNNEYGLPLMLARMPADTEYAVLELGMNHAGEIGPLSRMLRPHVALITTVQPVHIEFFDGIDGIADAKAEIFEGLETGGTAILPRDHALFHHLRLRGVEQGVGRFVTFGAHEEADIHLVEHDLMEDGSDVTATINGKSIRYHVGLAGRHQVMNSLGVAGVISEVAADQDAAIRAMSQVQPLKGRGKRTSVHLPGGGQFLVIDESYNASPAAMKAALEVLAQAQPGPDGRHIAVLGDMLELGDDAGTLHAALATTIEETGTDMVFTAGPLMAHLNDALPDACRTPHAPDSNALISPVIDAVRDGDVFMVKGSLGSRMAPVVDALLALDTPNGEETRHAV